MKILMLGGDGMLGHRLYRHFVGLAEVRVTLRQDLGAYAHHDLLDPAHAYFNVDVRSPERVLEVCAEFRPDAVINAVGIVKQRSTAKESIPSLEINSLLPHRLAVLCAAIGARLVHFSTDCVFSGARGMSREGDMPDATDLYGRSKLLGEVDEAHCLTLRTSIIGPELARKVGLIEWFLAQRGSIRGFTNAIFSGLTTAELSRVVEMMLTRFPHASGVYHVSSEPISKYDLLRLVRDQLGLDIEIVPDSSFRCDRSLDSSRFRTEFNYEPPSWPDMVRELGNELRMIEP